MTSNMFIINLIIIKFVNLLLFFKLVQLKNTFIMYSIKSISRDFNSYFYRDRNLKNLVEQKFNDHFYDTFHLNEGRQTSINRISRDSISEQSQERQKETKENKTLKKEFHYIRKPGKPFIDHQIRSVISTNNPNSNYSIARIPESSETENSDKESIRQYQVICPSLRRTRTELFVRASVAATRHLGSAPSFKTELWSEDKIPLMDPSQAIDFVINDSNSGFPLFQKKNRNATISDSLIWCNKLLRNPNCYTLFKSELLKNPKVLMHRFQPEIKDKELTCKIRQVWCESMRIILLENVFFRFILERYTKYNVNNQNAVSSHGMRNAEISAVLIQRLRNMIGSSNEHYLFSIDYSKYDRTIPDFAVDLFYSTFKSQLDLDYNKEKLYNLLRYFTKYGPIVHQDKLYFKSRGISSGSLLTNFFDTWWNLTLFYVSQILTNNSVTLDSIKHDTYEINNYTTDFRQDIAVCGDDGIVYTTYYEINVLIELCSYYKMSLKTKKPVNDPDEDIFFLGRFWNAQNEPIQTEEYLTAHICFRSKFYKKNELNIDISEELVPSRILSICAPFSNGMQYIYKTFPNYEPLVKLMKKRSFIYLKDFPLEDKNITRPIDDIWNWRMF